MKIRDRIKTFKRVLAADLEPHPLNWHVHGEQQANALRAALSRIGIAGVAIAWEPAPGRLQLIDGHLRAETLPDQKIPVVVLDVNEHEAKELLATHDAIGHMADVDPGLLVSLREQIDLQSPALEAALDQLAASVAETAQEADENEEDEEDEEPDGPIELAFQVVVTTKTESEQSTLFDRLTKAGYACRVCTVRK